MFQFLELTKAENLNILQNFTQSTIPIKKAPKKEKNIVKIVTNKQKLNKLKKNLTLSLPPPPLTRKFCSDKNKMITKQKDEN